MSILLDVDSHLPQRHLRGQPIVPSWAASATHGRALDPTVDAFTSRLTIAGPRASQGPSRRRAIHMLSMRHGPSL
jgi:hypothetical protein